MPRYASECPTLICCSSGVPVGLIPRSRPRAESDAGWLVLTTDQSFPRHHDRFIGALVRSLRLLLAAHPDAAAVSAIYWLRPDMPEP
jgi:hypothetical protein